MYTCAFDIYIYMYIYICIYIYILPKPILNSIPSLWLSAGMATWDAQLHAALVVASGLGGLGGLGAIPRREAAEEWLGCTW